MRAGTTEHRRAFSFSFVLEKPLDTVARLLQLQSIGRRRDDGQASGHKRRLQLVPPAAVVHRQAAAPSKPPAFEASALAAHRRPRLGWATLQHRTFGVDVWTCRCGGQRKVLSLVTSRRTAQEMLLSMGLLALHSPAPNVQAPPEDQLALSV